MFYKDKWLHNIRETKTAFVEQKKNMINKV